jgi:hypothetical protein
MEKKKYSWTISVIALLERNDLFQWKAYDEFERSITSIQHPNEDIKFSIYLYDTKDLKGYIKESRVLDGQYFLSIEAEESIADFYQPGYPHLISFFENHVAKKSVSDDEVHRHFFITWGHGTGIGFFSPSERIQLRALLANGFTDINQTVDEYLGIIETIQSVRAALSVNIDKINWEVLFSNEKLLINRTQLTNEQKAALIEYTRERIMKCVTASELAGIIQAGLKSDATPGIEKKIDFLLCLTCFTQMIETGYMLKKAVRIMIAPETTISHFGYNYKKLFTLLANRPDFGEKEISNCLVNNYLEKYTEEFISTQIRDEEINKVEYRRLVSFSSLRLDKYDLIIPQIKKFVAFAKSEVLKIRLLNGTDATNLQAIQYARTKCMQTSFPIREDMGVIDFRTLFMEFFKLYDAAGLKGVPEDLFLSLKGSFDDPDELIIAQFHPGYYSGFYRLGINQIVSMSAGSFGIFLPNSKHLNEREIDIYNLLKIGSLNTDFWVQTDWNLLIEAIQQ